MTVAADPVVAALSQVTGFFGRAAFGGSFAATDATAGLRLLLAAGTIPSDTALPASAITSVVSAIEAAAPVVADAVDRWIAPEAVYLGFSAATGFAGLFQHRPAELAAMTDLRLAADRLDHIALLADNLDALVRRRRIEDRGDIFRRTITIRRALATEPAGAALH